MTFGILWGRRVATKNRTLRTNFFLLNGFLLFLTDAVSSSGLFFSCNSLMGLYRDTAEPGLSDSTALLPSPVWSLHICSSCRRSHRLKSLILIFLPFMVMFSLCYGHLPYQYMICPSFLSSGVGGSGEGMVCPGLLV